MASSEQPRAGAPAFPLALPGLPEIQHVRPKFEPKLFIDPLRLMATNPTGCWAVFRTNGKSFQSIFEDYVFVLAAIPAVCGFIGRGVLGDTGIVQAFFMAIVGYIVSVLFLYCAAYLAHKTAQMFDGALSIDHSGKLVVYSMMPFFFAGSFLLIPPLAILSLAGTASIYFFIKGVGEMTSISSEKRLTYGLINVVAWVVVADAILGNIF